MRGVESFARETFHVQVIDFIDTAFCEKGAYAAFTQALPGAVTLQTCVKGSPHGQA